MASDREETLKKAEKLLRQGRLDAAIAEYARVVEETPRDLATANTLGDLYARAGNTDKAAAMYMRIADHLFHEGFYPRAAALYKKILKIKPDDETVQLNLGEISAKQGLLADARGYFTAIGERRRARGDKAGANEMIVRLGSLDPADFDARTAAARILAESGDEVLAASRYGELQKDLLEKGRGHEALAALRETVRLNPGDREARVALAREAVSAGDMETARAYLTREIAGNDVPLLLALANIELRSGALDEARTLIPEILALDPSTTDKIFEVGLSLVDGVPDAALLAIEAIVDRHTSAHEYADAASILQEFVTRVPGQVTALLKLVEVCVDGGLEATMYDAQAQLADAYLAAGQAAEARVIAEDLVAREPWEHAHLDRFRTALVMLGVPDPDRIIAERLSGEAPFTAKDPFADLDLGSVSETTPAGEEPPPPPPPKEPAPLDVVTEPEPEEPIVVAPPTPVVEPSRPAVPPPSSGKRPDGSVEIDLTGILGELQGAPPMPTPPPDSRNLDQVFKDFRDEVSRQTGDEEAEQHLKLARTFLEVGMPDEAIGSLTTAARAPRYRFEAASMLGRLHRDQKDTVKAIEWLERAAEAPAPSVEDGRALLYDLGTTLESAGETARALAVFLELQADADDYRDVAARVDRLSRVQTGG